MTSQFVRTQRLSEEKDSDAKEEEVKKDELYFEQLNKIESDAVDPDDLALKMRYGQAPTFDNQSQVN